MSLVLFPWLLVKVDLSHEVNILLYDHLSKVKANDWFFLNIYFDQVDIFPSGSSSEIKFDRGKNSISLSIHILC